MSDGFPSDSCAGAILSRGGVVEAGGRFLASVLVFCRGCKMVGVQTHLTLGLRVLWRAMRAGRSIVVPGSDGERLGCSRWR
jgi:hypothetical protein